MFQEAGSKVTFDVPLEQVGPVSVGDKISANGFDFWVTWVSSGNATLSIAE